MLCFLTLEDRPLGGFVQCLRPAVAKTSINQLAFELNLIPALATVGLKLREPREPPCNFCRHFKSCEVVIWLSAALRLHLF